MITAKKPWEIHEQLQPDRLHTIGAVLKDVRRKALMIYDPEEGDGRWSSECTIYQRTLNTLIKYCDVLPWFKIRNIGLYFVMFIDGVPIRYFRGEIQKPKKNSLNIRTDELLPHEQFCLFDQENAHWHWRIVVIADEERMTSEIAIVQYHDETEGYRNLWFFDQDQISTVHLVGSTVREAKVLAPAPLGLIPDSDVDERNFTYGDEG